jgi:nicotinate dehydrogenase subunit A
MAIFNLNVNGQARSVEVESGTPLLYVLSDELELRGPKFGCGLGQCGSCTVLLGAEAVRSCVTPVERAVDAEITTLEGLGGLEGPHPIQQAFIAEQAVQCGFCINGVILTAKAYLDRSPAASDADVGRAMSGVLCRCGTHTRILAAIRRYRDGRNP